MQCDSCGTQNEAGSVFCFSCGARIDADAAGAREQSNPKCVSCGAALELEDAFCPVCGAPRKTEPPVPPAPIPEEPLPDRAPVSVAPSPASQPFSEPAPNPRSAPLPKGSAGSRALPRYVALALVLLVLGGAGILGFRNLDALRDFFGGGKKPQTAMPPATPQAQTAVPPVAPPPAEPTPAPESVPPAPGPARSQTSSAAANQSPYFQPPVQPSAAPSVSYNPIEPAPRPAPDRSVSEPARTSPTVQSARLIKRVEPVYPELARHNRVEGTVSLKADIDETGKVKNVRVLHGSPLLRDEAVRAVKQWKYSPARLHGKPVAVVANISVVFKLR
jgi:TonB family protein